jgi:hypothetical protein
MTMSEEISGWRVELDAPHGRTAKRFGRSEARERAKRYLAGLLDRINWTYPGLVDSFTLCSGGFGQHTPFVLDRAGVAQ